MWEFIFYLAAGIAVISTLMVITRLNAVHALLYLIALLLAVAVIFFVLGAPLVAMLEVIIYAGAIMVLFIFVIMMLNLGPHAIEAERQLLSPRMFIGPVVLVAILAAVTLYALSLPRGVTGDVAVSPREVGLSLYGTYLLGVELASLLLFTGLIGAYHLARRII